MYSDCRGRLQHKGSFGFVQNAEKIVQVAWVFFLTKTSSAENKATIYLTFLPTCLQELTRDHHLIFIHGTLPLTLGLNMCETDIPTLPSLLSILKDFAVRQYVLAACDTKGTSITLCVCSFLEHSSDPHEIKWRGVPYELVKTLLEFMTDVISEGSGEHMCLHNLVRVSLTNKV